MVGAAGFACRPSSAAVLSGMQGLHSRFQSSISWRLMLGMCWHALHIFVSIVHLGSYLFHFLYFSIISSSVLQKYRVLPLHKLQCLAIVVDSEEAEDTSKIMSLVQCLSNVGLKQVVLYDMEGVLKKYEASLRKWTTSSMAFSEHGVHTSTILGDQEKMSLEILSYSDGKEAIAKAASFLCSKYLKDNLVGNQREPVFTETDIADALKTVGCGGPEPDLLLVFSPIRCHFGFPAWRLRYTEIVHMGALKSMKHGAVIKAIYDLSKKHQNYGS